MYPSIEYSTTGISIIGINDIMSMLITGNGKNWAKSKSIYEENPKEFCKQKWFTMFSFKLTRSLFHYRNGRRMQGSPLPATHSEKDHHEKHYEHYSKVCQCKKEDLPTVNGRTPICNTSSSNSTVGDVCQVGYIQVFLMTENSLIIITHSRI